MEPPFGWLYGVQPTDGVDAPGPAPKGLRRQGNVTWHRKLAAPTGREPPQYEGFPPDTIPTEGRSPVDSRPIYVDALREDLDAARRKYRRAYDRGYLLSQQGQDEKAQKVLDAANAAWERAQRNYAAARAANPVPEWAKEGAA